MKKTFIIITTLILSLLFTSCITSSDVTYKVKYIVNEEIYLIKEVKANEKLDNIEAPKLEYYEFINWLNKETNEPYDFSLPLKSDLELIAEYSKIANLAGGEEGKYYDFSNLTDEELFEITGKLEDFLIDQVVAIPFYNSAELYLLSDRIKYPVDKSFGGYELYSDFIGESVFKYVIDKGNFFSSDIANINEDLLFKGLYSYEYNEDLLSNKLVPYFAKGDPVCLDEEGYVWKVYIDEGFKFSDGSDVKFEDFVNAYELNLKNVDALGFALMQIKNIGQYKKGECERKDVGIEYNYEEKAIIFTFRHPNILKEVKNLLTYPVFGPIPFFELIENEDYSKYKFVGEYVLKSFENNVIIYEKNPFYVNKNKVLKNFEKIEYHCVDDKNAGYNMYIEGLVDYVELSKELFDEYSDYENNIVKTGSNGYGIQVNLNENKKTDMPILYNQNFRKALYYGTNIVKYIGSDNILNYDFTLPQSYFSDSYKILYQGQIEPNPYNVSLSLDYYVKALDELIDNKKLENKEKTVIEVEVIYADDIDDDVDVDKIFEDYEELFNSQRKYPNIKLLFKVEKMDYFELRYQYIYQGNYDLAFYHLGIITYIGNHMIRLGDSSNSEGYRFYSPIFNEVYDDLLLEFNNEYFTFKALALALVNGNNVYIKNGKLIDIEWRIA